MRALALPLLALGLVHCGDPDFERLETSAVVISDLGGSVGPSALTVPVGLAVKANLLAYDEDGHLMALGFEVANPAVLAVEPAVGGAGYVFVGLAVGHTEVRLVANGQVVRTLSADVLAQPSQP